MLREENSEFLKFVHETQLELYFETYKKISLFETDPKEDLAEEIIEVLTRNDESFSHFMNLRKNVIPEYDISELSSTMFMNEKNDILSIIKRFYMFHADGQYVNQLPSLKSRIQSPMENDRWSSIDKYIPPLPIQKKEEVSDIEYLINTDIVLEGYHIELGFFLISLVGNVNAASETELLFLIC